MLADIIDALRCPLCAGDVRLTDDGAVRCGSGHSYDVARHGYVNMLPGDAKTGTADTAAMLEARAAFLARGHFSALTDAVVAVTQACTDGVEGCVLDVGAGTGHHFAAVLDAMGDRAGVALDISKHAARKAARAHARIGAVVSDAWWGLPVRSGAVAAVLDIFAPRNPEEFARVLAPLGPLVIVTPGPEHLAELRDILGLIGVDERKDERIDAAFAGLFDRIEEHEIRFTMSLSREDALTVASMGPTAHHVDRQESARRAANLPQRTDVTGCARVTVFRRVT